MTTYKTTSGLTRAIEKTISQLQSCKIESQQEYESARPVVDNLTRQCDSLWSNPADVEDFAKLKVRLLEAWHLATN